MAALNGISEGDVPNFLQKLRSSQDANFDRDALILKSQRALDRATAAVPRMIDDPLVQAITISPISPEMEATFPAGYYQPGDPGPAHLMLNTSRASDRQLMAEVIAFHEGLPGHHVAYGFGYPAGQFNSGFAEGWAIYSEYLADEMGLYSSAADRTGMMAKHLWAASRLIVEPGIHLRGWSRKRAFAFMRAHTALSDAEINLELDRYIAFPGQSLSYMLGYEKIAQARRYAQQRLGSRFDLRAFRKIVLAKGSRPLDEAYADVAAWADREALKSKVTQAKDAMGDHRNGDAVACGHLAGDLAR